MVADPAAAAAIVAVNCACAAPAGTRTDAGTCTDELLLDRVTSVFAAAFPLSATVHVAVDPADRMVWAHVIEESVVVPPGETTRTKLFHAPL